MAIKFWLGTWRGCNPDGLSHTRSRKVIRHTGGIPRTKTPSRKTGRMVHAEGLLEDDAILHFELSPFILSYREQVEPVHYPDSDRLRKYTPDFELVLQTGEVILVEVKPKANCEKDEIKHKLARINEHLARIGKTFVVITDEDVRQEPRRSNLRWLYGQIPRIGSTQAAMQACVNRHWQQFPMNYQETRQLLQASNIHPVSLLVAGYLHCDLSQPLSNNSLISIQQEADDGWFYLKKAHGF